MKIANFRLMSLVGILILCFFISGSAQTDLPLEEIPIEKGGGSVSPVSPPVSAQPSPYNLLKNGSFEEWSADISQPEDWVLENQETSVVKASEAPIGAGAAELISEPNKDAILHQTILPTISEAQNSWAKGKTFTLGAWVKASESSKAVLTIKDGVGTAISSAHSGSGNYEWLSVTKTLDSNAKELRVELNLLSSSIPTAATFDGATLVEAPNPFAFSPNPQDVLGPITINGDEVNIDGTLQTENLKIPSGAKEGYVLTSDQNGLGTWQSIYAAASSKDTGVLTLDGEADIGEIKLPPPGDGKITGIGGSGTANYISKFTASTTLGNSNIFEINGSVGIGTTTPSEQLTVAGTIQSLSGGFRFPDGTSQVTAQLVGPTGLQGSQGPPGVSPFSLVGNDAVYTQGNVGIGDVTPAALLTVGTSDALQVDSSGNLSTSGTVTIGSGTVIAKHLSTTATWDPTSLANASSTLTAVTLTGVAAGDVCGAALDTITNAKWLMSAFVASTNTVIVTIMNITGGTVDLASGTLRVSCWQY